MSASVALSRGKRSLSTRCEGYIGGYILKSCIKDSRIDGPPIMPEDPYAYIMAAYEVPPSPDYIPGPEVPPSPDYIPGLEGPPSPDYVPGPEEPEQAPPSPVYLPYVPGDGV
ncbi:hypothetical protein Tco_0085573 [Tanacetum coccineum]